MAEERDGWRDKMRPEVLERIIWSLLLIGAGVGILLSNLHIISFDVVDLIMRFWPILLILIGIKMIFDALRQYRDNGGWWFSLFIGGIITLVGWNLLAERVGLQEIRWSLIWEMMLPIILILIGLRFLLGGEKRNRVDDELDRNGFHVEVDMKRKKTHQDPHDPAGIPYPPAEEERGGGRHYDEREVEPTDDEGREEEERSSFTHKEDLFGKEGKEESRWEEKYGGNRYGNSRSWSGDWSVYREKGKGWSGLFEGGGYYAEGRNRRRKFHKSALIGEMKLVRNLFELEDMSLWNGIGDVSIDFSKAKMRDGETEVEIRGWLGDVKLYIPRELPVWLDIHLGLGDYRIFDEHQNGMGKTYTYRSPDYETAPRRLHLHIDYKIGDIKILDV